MSKKSKLPSELSLAELLEKVEGQDLTEEYHKVSLNDPVLSFIQHFKISEGTHSISVRDLHKLYKLWESGKKLTLNAFTFHLNHYLPGKKIGANTFFKVNLDILELVKKIEENSKNRNLFNSIVIHKHFEKFLRDTDLKPGGVWVEGDILYYIYNNWCDKVKRKQPLTYVYFIGFCELNFDKKTLSGMEWFRVSQSVKQQIKPEEVARWRQGRLKRYGKKDEASSKKFKREETLYQKNQKKQK